METDIATGGAPDEFLRAAMVDQLRDHGLAGSARVEAAMRMVPRHLFVADVTVERAYAQEVVVTRRDADGVAVSSASAPGVVAGMLDQLDVRPAQRVLEIGAGTGYNAALLAHLAGPQGAVTTIDIDPDVASGAQRALADAGYPGVSVACGDGEFGWPGHAPYDRIIVTAGAWDLPPAWRDQLAPGGRLVVPPRMRGLTRSVAFEREDGRWRSRSIDELGFMPIRGAGAVAERNLSLGSHGDITLRIDDGQPADSRALSAALGHPPALARTGVTLPRDGLGHLDFWLATADGFGRLIVTSPAAVGRGFIAPVYDWGSMAVFGPDTLAYLTKSPGGGTAGATGADGGRPDAELGVCAYGPRGGQLAGRVADRVRAWDRDRPSIARLWIEAYRAGTGGTPGDLMVIDKRHTRVAVRISAL